MFRPWNKDTFRCARKYSLFVSPDLPSLLVGFIAWIESNPAKGVVALLLIFAGGLWLLRRAAKIFLGLTLLLIVCVVGSYFFVGGEKTDAIIRDGALEGIERAERLRKEFTE